MSIRGRRAMTPYVDVTRGRRDRKRSKKKPRALPEGTKVPAGRRPASPPASPWQTNGVKWVLASVMAIPLVGLLIWLLRLVVPAEMFASRMFGGLLFLIFFMGIWAVDVFAMKKERLWRRTRLRPRARMRFGERGLAATCAYCRTAFSAEEQVACPGCEAAYHLDCREELGGCATLGCSEARPRVRLTNPAGAKKID